MCCLFGILDYGNSLTAQQRAAMLSILATECEARGTDATGIAYNSGGKLRIYKRPKAAHTLRFVLPQDANFIMGHTRMTTQGRASRNRNNHPFPGKADGTAFALAHNGVLYNDASLRRVRHLPLTRIQTDSYVAVQLLERQQTLSFDSLRSMAETVEGSFTFSVLDSLNHLYFVRGDNPLCIYHYPGLRLYLYASTEQILGKAVSRMRLPLAMPDLVPVSCGDMLCIDSDGQIQRERFQTDQLFPDWCYSGRQSVLPYEYSVYDNDEHSYWAELRSVAASFGYAPDDITALGRQGFSPEEIEELLYCAEI